MSLHRNPMEISVLSPAPHGARFGAFIVDAITLSVAVGFLTALGLPDIMDSVLGLLYFTVCHHVWGQTLGKRLFGLKVVRADGSKLGLGGALLRESFGRFAAAFFFALGYIWIFVSNEHRGWHDLVSGTAVVSTRDESLSDRHSFPIWKGFALAFGALGCLFAIGVYSVLFTSLPFQRVADRLALEGVEIDGISGSLMHGLSIERLSYSNERAAIELNQITVDYNIFDQGSKESDGERPLVIKGVTVTSGSIKIHKRAKQNGAGSPSGPETASEAGPESDSYSDQAALREPASEEPEDRDPFRFVVEQIDVENLKIENPYTKSFDLRRLFVDRLDLRDSGVTLGQVWVESEVIDLNVGDLRFDRDGLELGKLAQVSVKAKGWTEYVRKDIKIEVTGRGSVRDRDVESLYVGAFDRRLQLKKNLNGYTLQTFALTPAAYITGLPPVHKVSLKAEGSSFASLLEPKEARFDLRNATFVLKETNRFEHQRGAKTFTLSVGPIEGSKRPALRPTSTLHTTVHDWLADVYFDRNLASLTERERQVIDLDAVHFAPLETPGAPETVAPGPPISAPAQRGLAGSSSAPQSPSSPNLDGRRK